MTLINFFKNSLLFLLITGPLAVACGSRAPVESNLSEAPDRLNDISAIGLDGVQRWEDVSGPVSAQIGDTPWTDTYWPTFMKGMAYRYLSNDPQALEIFSLHSFLEEYFSAVDSGKVERLVKLSPAEKHDLISNGNLEQFGDLNREQLLDAAAAIDTNLKARFAEINSLRGEQRRDQKLLALRQAIGETRSLLSRLETSLPLVSDSWKQWASVSSNTSNQIHGNSLVIDGTNLIDANARNWGWEGLCHGWAAASIYSERPKHAVMAVRDDGVRVLFTEGDIRGLLTKSWADHSGANETFIGGRCNVEPDSIETDELGRLLDAKVSCAGNPDFVECQESSGQVGLVFKDRSYISGQEVIRYRASASPLSDRYLVFIRWARGWGANSTFFAYQFDSLADLRSWFRAGQPGRIGFAIDALNVCRDVNPKTMHLLLTRFLAEGRAFVMDRAREAEVWNQPVKGYTLEYPTIFGIEGDGREPVSTRDLNDLHWRYRAPGTEYLVQVRANLNWVNELGPYISYSGMRWGQEVSIDERALHVMQVDYTLELDADKHVIGGEWGHVPIEGGPVLPESRSGAAPDFVYFYEEGTEPSPHQNSGIDYPNVVKKIHACSLDEQEHLKESSILDNFGSPIMYRECRI